MKEKEEKNRMVRVAEDLARKIKVEAATRDITMGEMMSEMFRIWKKYNKSEEAHKK